MLVFDLPDHEFVEVAGPDAHKFLQGQVSCNLELLSDTRSLAGAICNLKGRAIADFQLLWTGEACLLQTSRGMADKIVATLSRYAVFSKVELRRIQPPLALGILDREADADLRRLFPEPLVENNQCAASGGLRLLRLPGGRFELWCLDDAAAAAARELFGAWEPVPVADWVAAEIEAGVVHIGPAISEKYTPQLLNYDLSGVIDFNKGCYTGQEVVARMHFRGKPKKRMFLFRGEQAFSVASRICQPTEEEPQRGEPLLAHANRADGSNLALAVAGIDAVAANSEWRLDACPEAPLLAIPLSYQ